MKFPSRGLAGWKSSVGDLAAERGVWDWDWDGVGVGVVVEGVEVREDEIVSRVVWVCAFVEWGW